MKKLAFALALAAATTASAAMQRIATVQIANTAQLQQAAAMLGNHIANPMASGLCAAGLADNPVVSFFGPMRDGADASALVGVYIDPARIEGGTDGAFEVTILYPTTGGKAAFLARHQNAFETNGVVMAEADVLDDPLAVAFSDDGAWCAVASSAARAKAALRDVKAASRKMQSDVLRLSIDKRGIATCTRLVEMAVNTCEREAKTPADRKCAKDAKDALVCLRGISSCAFSFAVSSRGLDFAADATVVPDSVPARFFLQTLPPDALAFAGPSAVFAAASAPGASSGTAKPGERLAALLRVLKTLGIDAGRFLSHAVADDTVNLTIDPAAFVDYVAGNETNGLATAILGVASDTDAALKKVEAEVEAMTGKGLVPSTSSCRFALNVKGYVGQSTLAQRFAAAFPELRKTKLVAQSVTSYIEILRAFLPGLEPLVPDDQQPLLQLVKTQLSAGTTGCTASASWRTGNRMRMLARASVDELHSIGSIVNAVIAYQAMQESAAAQKTESAGAAKATTAK